MLRALSDDEQNAISTALSTARMTAHLDAEACIYAGQDRLAQAHLDFIPQLDNLTALIADRVIFVGEEGDA